MSSAQGDREGVAFKQKSPRPAHTPRPSMGGKNTQQRHCKEQAWRPGASDTGLLCAGAWPLPPQGPAPPKKKKQQWGWVLLKQGGQMKESQTDTQTHPSSRKTKSREKQTPRRGGRKVRGQLFCVYRPPPPPSAPPPPRATPMGEGQHGP